MYKKVLLKDELPPIGVYITTIDSNNNHVVYKMNEDKSFTMKGTYENNNSPIIYWLKEGGYYLFSYHLGCRIDEGWGNMALVFASNQDEAKEILIKEKTISKETASIGLAFGWNKDIVPDNIYCLNL